MTKAVLWDLDGTILDTTELILESYRYAFSKILKREISETEAIANFGRTLADVMSGYSPEKAEVLIESYREYNHKNHDRSIRPFPGIIDALANVQRRGFKQAVVTSKTEWLSRKGLKLFDLEDYFDEIIGFESTELHKPDGAPVLEALKRLRVSPDEAIFIGDSAADAGCAQNADVRFVTVTWGPNSEFIENCNAWTRIEDPRDVLHIIPEKGPRI